MPNLHTPLAQQLYDLPVGWQDVVDAWVSSPSGRALLAYVDERVAQGGTVHPPQVFRALHLTTLEKVKIVMVGQDPYHGPGQAQGLAFSVSTTQRPPPSLRNIFTELHRDLHITRTNPDLTDWAEQGVLLLNRVLTVEQGQPASHAGHGWEALTQALLQAVAQRQTPCVYLLWGAQAQQLEPYITSPHAYILKANHPSPLSAHRPPIPFIGCGHFGLASRYLQSKALTAVTWG